MDYFKVLNLSKEPFSNSPDPEFFFQSGQHMECLQKLELSVRLRRGLNVITGDVGTGKTTLSRQLVRKLADDTDLETHLILDPNFATPSEFLTAITGMFGLSPELQSGRSEWQIKDGIQKYLFQRGVDEQKLVILIIDEGQKLPSFCLEILRELLNYEVNEYKLLQIVIFAQREFEEALARHRNFVDRINLFSVLGPLKFSDTRRMIQFRLNQAKSTYKAPALFTYPGFLAVHLATGGYPRRIIHLCHRIVLTLIIRNKKKAGWFLARWCSAMTFPEQKPRRRQWVSASLLFIVLSCALGFGFFPKIHEHLQIPAFSETASSRKMESPTPVPEPKKPVEEETPPKATAHEDEVQTAARDAQVITAPNPPSAIGEAVAQRAVHELSPPAALGDLSVRRGENLWLMLGRVYGSYDPQVLRAVAEMNPHIGNVSKVGRGRAITFPAIPFLPHPSFSTDLRVELALKQNLKDAYAWLKAYPLRAPPVRMLPIWTPREGLKFHLLLKHTFPDEESAKMTLSALPASLAANARIVTGSEAGSVFFGR